jgi:hypothetical protein
MGLLKAPLKPLVVISGGPAALWTAARLYTLAGNAAEERLLRNSGQIGN